MMSEEPSDEQECLDSGRQSNRRTVLLRTLLTEDGTGQLQLLKSLNIEQ
jgi:hypothetical protein